MDGEIKLLPCPFCGDEAILLKDHHKLGLYVACTGCSACTITAKRVEAIAAWNRRTPPTPDAVTEVAFLERARNELARREDAGVDARGPLRPDPLFAGATDSELRALAAALNVALEKQP